MNRKFPLLILFFSALCTGIKAQTALKGRLLNSKGEAVEFATIALLKSSDSSIVKGSYTNERGEYTIEQVMPGSYLIRAMVVGLGRKQSTVFVVQEGQTGMQVEDLRYAETAVELKTVEISAVKPVIEFKNGNTILNVDNTALAAGNNAYDLLTKAPGVSIDNNNNISIQGKQGVKVMIDGRMQQLSNEQLANLLKSMSAEGIDKIEIMKNPGAKYDAEGTSGIIQIKTKKAKLSGFNGSATAGVNKGELWGGNAGTSLNYKGEKFSVFSSLNFSERNRLKKMSLYRAIGQDSNRVGFDQHSTENQHNRPVDYKLGADWYLSDKTTLGLVYDGGQGQILNTVDNTTGVTGNNTLGFDYLKALGNSPSNWNNHNLNLNGQHKFDTSGTQLDISLDYTAYNEVANNYYSNRFYTVYDEEVGTDKMFPNIYKTNTLSDIFIRSGKADFTKKLHKKLLLESGLKYSNVDTRNNLLFERKDSLSEGFYNDTRYSNQFRYTEVVSAGYANLQQEIKHGSIQLGLRGEHTRATGFNITSNTKTIREYFQLFPNLSIDYGKSDNHKFQLSYSRRINRPDYFQLNPFKYYLDQYTSSEGNPFLNPETSHNGSFTYIYKQFLYNTLSVQRKLNVIQELTVQDDATKETKQITRNIKASNNYSYDVFAYLPIKKWWTARVNFTAWYMDFEGNINGNNYKKGQFGGVGNLFNEFNLPKDFVVELSAMYQTPLLWGIFQVGRQSSVDVGVKKTFLDRKLSLKIGLSDIFYMSNTNVKVNLDNQHFNIKQLQDTRRVRFTLTYNFGNTRFKMREIKSNDAEKNRLKNGH